MLNKYILTKLYYSYIDYCLTYANIAWVSTHKTKLHKTHSKQTLQFALFAMKTNLRLLSLHDIPTGTQCISKNHCVYALCQNLVMCQVFLQISFTYPSHRYPTNLSKNNFALPKYLIHKSTFHTLEQGSLKLFGKTPKNFFI